MAVLLCAPVDDEPSDELEEEDFWPLKSGGAFVIERVVSCMGTCKVTVVVPSNSSGLKMVFMLKLAFCVSRLTVANITELNAGVVVLLSVPVVKLVNFNVSTKVLTVATVSAVPVNPRV